MGDKHVEALLEIRKLVNEALSDLPKSEPRKRATRRTEPSERSVGAVSFNMNVLAFMNKYARGLIGPKKFTLLVAHLVKGDIEAQVTWQQIDGQWNKMKTLLGPSNPVHGNRAKAYGWVEPVKSGTWKLTESWKAALTE